MTTDQNPPSSPSAPADQNQENSVTRPDKNQRPKISLKMPLSIEKQAQLEALRKPMLIKTAPARTSTRPNSKTSDARKHADSFFKTPGEMDQNSAAPQKTKKQKGPIDDLGSAVKWLYKTYPQLFMKDRSKPLKCGVEKDIIKDMGDHPAVVYGTLKKAIRHYVFSFPYMTTMLTAMNRFDLDGKPVEGITDDHRKFAVDWIKERELEKKKED